MHALVESHRQAIAELCRRYGVTRLDLFGSAADGEFDPQSSDLDLIVRFAEVESPGIARRFVGLAEDLERLLGRPVDLVTDQPFRNPYFAQTVAETRETIYEQ
jgi:predicted nucleotidyltransferase